VQQDWSVIIAAATLAFIVLSSVGGLVWRLSRIELSMRAEATAEITEVKDAHSKELATLSAKLYQVEIWARDEFVRKGSFETVIARMEKGFSDLRQEITGRLDRMTDSIEHGRQHERG
jgi:hypothetical protein